MLVTMKISWYHLIHLLKTNQEHSLEVKPICKTLVFPQNSKNEHHTFVLHQRILYHPTNTLGHRVIPKIFQIPPEKVDF